MGFWLLPTSVTLNDLELWTVIAVILRSVALEEIT